MIGTTELLIIFGIALLLFGPEKLPKLAKSVGETVRTFKESSERVSKEIYQEVNSSSQDQKPAEKPENKKTS